MWQSQGLDLHIIPYGCMATGNMMGMIQVVQDAETVAKVMNERGRGGRGNGGWEARGGRRDGREGIGSEGRC